MRTRISIAAMGGLNTATQTRTIGETASAKRSGSPIAQVLGSTSEKISTISVITSVA